MKLYINPTNNRCVAEAPDVAVPGRVYYDTVRDYIEDNRLVVSQLRDIVADGVVTRVLFPDQAA